jgi:hypothetical protein
MRESFAGRLNTAALSLCWLAFALLGLSGVMVGLDERPVDGGTVAFGAALAVASLVLAVRAFRMGVVLEPSQVVVRNLFRTYRLSWVSIRGARGGPAYSLVPATILLIDTGGGELRVPGVAQVRDDGAITRCAARIHERLNGGDSCGGGSTR